MRNVMKLGVTLLCLLPMCLLAQVYKSVDKQGNVTYTDAPELGGKKVNLPPIMDYTPPPEASTNVPVTTPNAPLKTTPYQVLQFITPFDQQTLQNIAGNLNVAVEVEPALWVGHTLVIALDNHNVAQYPGDVVPTPEGDVPPSSQFNVTLTQVSRGEHTLQARILDAKKRVLIENVPITIYVHQATRLLPKS